MTLHRKLNLGLGFLFAVIFGLVFFCSYYVQKIAADSENVLKDNYVSVGYAKTMASGIDTMYASATRATSDQLEPGAFDRAKQEFEHGLSLEQGNITEVHEQEYVQTLATDYARYLTLINPSPPGGGADGQRRSELTSVYLGIRSSIDKVFDVNMEAIFRKNQVAREGAKRIGSYMVGIGVSFLLLALGYFWYFPFYVSHSIAFLAHQMKQLVADAGVEQPPTGDDEQRVILTAIDVLRSKWRLPSRRP